MHRNLAGLTLACALPWIGCQAQQRTVPFVGCPADGQVGRIAAPKGAPRVLPIRNVPTGEIAYYKGESAPGVFAPSGWFCQVSYGSSGGAVLVTPTPIDTTSWRLQTVLGPAVEMSLSYAGTSGRFSVAIHGAGLFPKRLSRFIANVRTDYVVPDSEFAPHRYSHDSVTLVDSLVAEFTTPSRESGLGTDGPLGPAMDPIRGVAAIAPDSTEPDMTVLRIRLGANMRALENLLLRLNKECMETPDGC